MASSIVKHHDAHTITLTDSAAKHIQKNLDKNPNAIGFRLGVKEAGCNSKKYLTEYIEKETGNSKVFIDKNIKIFVHNDDLLYLAGTKIDYVKDGINWTLKYYNPNVTTACGCGESFNIE